MSYSETELSNFITRTNVYQQCIDQLKRDIPRYLGKQARIKNTQADMIEGLKTIASNETTLSLKTCLMLYRKKHEVLTKEREVFERCEAQCLELLEKSKQNTLKPVQEIIRNSPQMRSDRPYPDSTLPIHSHFFELHRVDCLKTVLRNVVHSEMAFYCRGLEHLTEVLGALDRLDDEVEENFIGRKLKEKESKQKEVSKDANKGRVKTRAERRK